MRLRGKQRLEHGSEQVFAPSKKLRRSIYLLPSAFTVANIFAGFYAVISTLNGQYGAAAVAIGIAVVLDGLDGLIARLANATSDFGVQLDSLADVISFGLAPAVLIYSWGLVEFGKFAQFSAFLFLICGAIRLARFNLRLGDLRHFAGLPSPAAAGFVAATVHLFGQLPQSELFRFYLAGVTILISFLMVSTIRYPSLKKLNLGYGKSHLNVLVLAVLVAGVIWYSQQVLMSTAALYVCSGLFARGYQFIRYHAQESERLSTKT